MSGIGLIIRGLTNPGPFDKFDLRFFIQKFNLFLWYKVLNIQTVIATRTSIAQTHIGIRVLRPMDDSDELSKLRDSY